MMVPKKCEGEVYIALVNAINDIFSDIVDKDPNEREFLDRLAKYISKAAPVIIKHVQDNAQSKPGVSGGPLV